MRINPFILMLLCLVMFFFGPLKAATVIPVQFRDGLIWIKVEVPGIAEHLNFLLDSGAGVSVIDSAAAKRMGLHFGAAERVQGVQESVMAYEINRFAGRVGGVALPSRLLALDLRTLSAACGRRLDGLVGADFFKNRIVEIDFRSESLRLLSRAELNRSGCESLPLVQRHDALCTRVSVAGGAGAWVRVDTGCDSALRWVISSDRASRRTRSSIGTTVQSPRYVSMDVQMGSLQFSGVKTGIHHKQIFPGEAGLLGNGLLSRFVVTFDMPGRRLLLKAE